MAAAYYYRPHTAPLRESPDLPPHDALSRILPEYEHLFRAHGNPVPAPVVPAARMGSKSQGGSTARHTLPPQPTSTAERMDPHSSVVLDYQTKELDGYRSVLRKMADDILALRREVGRLESENSRLRSEMSLHREAGRALLADADLDVMTKSELADRLVSLKQKVAMDTRDMKGYKDKVQQLQNELIRKNEREHELLQLRRVHQQQQAALHKCQERAAQVKRLEETIRQQEKVMEKMERLLERQARQKATKRSESDTPTKDGDLLKDVELVLGVENARLRMELERLRAQPHPHTQQRPPQDAFSVAEKMALLAKVERAEGRVRQLEEELKVKAKKWGRERQDYVMRLTERSHGFTRTSTDILHGFPVAGSLLRQEMGRRHGQLEPLV
uniref:Coiled-coil domain-containing protein 33-like isoform X1 n=1 Tax=Petromyzon marinus TaxID=7757 RepID=A0AAJ7TWV9_PETMA|nr:coiled-coil domain-containing protein 33-like isoform X1 [Petromyzon marinus]